MKILLLFSFLLSTVCAFAQQQYTFTNYTQEQGLPSGTIRGIYKDTTGYIWFTSEGSLARFDGYTYKTYRYNPDVPSGLPGNLVWEGAFPKFGDIYFGTREVFFSFHPATESFTAPLGDSIEMLYLDEARDVKDCYWLRSRDTLYRISQNGTERYSLPYAMPLGWNMRPSPGNNCMLFNNNMLFNNAIKDVLFYDYQTKLFSKPKILDRNGMEDESLVADVIFAGNNFYLFTSKSLYRFDFTAKSFVWQLDLKRAGNFDYWAAGYLPYNDTLVVIRSKSGFINTLNIRTGEEKLVYVNKKLPETKLNDRFILSTVSDKNGGVWMGTNNMGLIYYNVFTNELEQYIHEPANSNSLPGNFVNWVMPDENGVVWASCFGHGIVKMEPVAALFKTAIPAATKDQGAWVQRSTWSENIRSFFETKDGYWISTLDGLYGYSNQTRKYSNLNYLCPERDSTNSVINPEFSRAFPIGSVAKDHSGNLWIGTWYGQLAVYNTDLKESFLFRRPQPMKDRDSEGVVRNLFCDSKNRMWISTKGAGVVLVDCNALNFPTINEATFAYHYFDEKDSTSLASGVVFVVVEDADGHIWAGTENGLCRYNEQTKNWKRYYNIPGNTKSLHHSNIRSLCLDKKGTLWIGTNGGGLNRYNIEEDNFTHFTIEDGLADNKIYSLVCDDYGMLWMGTSRGLCRFNPQDYSCTNFTKKDGIQNYEYNTGAALKLKNGTILFGGVAGYNIIDPDLIENKKAAPPVVVIASFKVFDKETPLGNHTITLKHKENTLAFEFAALSYFQNQENQYAYMLEGVDPDWIFSDTRRNVTYSKLAPGEYTFKVKASNSDGVWNETGTQLLITIAPPWWQQTWFILLCCLLTIAILYFIDRYDRNRKKQLEAVRARISRDLHDDMGSTLQSISVMSEIARMKSQANNTQESIPFIEKIGSASREMVEKMNDIVWAVNPANDHFENIILHMRAFGGELLAGKDIALHFKADSGLNNIRLSMEKRKSFFLVYKEALNNAYKYSDAKNVNVEITKTNHTLKLVVEDDGAGFNMNEHRLKTGGNGLKNIYTRATEMNGIVSVTSAPGQGTKVNLTVNLGK
jgi:ligand-binding sensor domain-containing protein